MPWSDGCCIRSRNEGMSRSGDQHRGRGNHQRRLGRASSDAAPERRTPDSARQGRRHPRERRVQSSPSVAQADAARRRSGMVSGCARAYRRGARSHPRDWARTMATGGLSNAFWAPVSMRKRRDGSTAVFPHFLMDRGKPGMITVNRSGKRFLNETTSYHLFGIAMQEEHKQTELDTRLPDRGCGRSAQVRHRHGATGRQRPRRVHCRWLSRNR